MLFSSYFVRNDQNPDYKDRINNVNGRPFLISSEFRDMVCRVANAHRGLHHLFQV